MFPISSPCVKVSLMIWKKLKKKEKKETKMKEMTKEACFKDFEVLKLCIMCVPFFSEVFSIGITICVLE